MEFVAAAPLEEAGVMLARADEMARDGREFGDEAGVVGRTAVHAGGREGKFLPDEETGVIAGVVERVGFERGAAPYAEEIAPEVAIESDEASRLGRRRIRVTQVDRRPVDALEKERTTVDDAEPR